MDLRLIGQRTITVVLTIFALVVGVNTVWGLFSGWRRSSNNVHRLVGNLVGDSLPTFPVIGLDSSRMTIPVRGRPTLLYFFSTTCGACLANEAAWEDLSRQVADRATSVVLSFESERVLLDYTAAASGSYLFARLDPLERPAAQLAYQMFATPTLYLLDHHAVLRYAHVGVFSAETTAEVLALLALP